MAFTRPLKDVLPRLELLGFNLDRVRREYEIVAERSQEEGQALSDDDVTDSVPDPMSFGEFYEFSTCYPLSALDDTFISPGDGKEKEKVYGRFSNCQVHRIPGYSAYDIHAYSERSYF